MEFRRVLFRSGRDAQSRHARRHRTGPRAQYPAGQSHRARSVHAESRHPAAAVCRYVDGVQGRHARFIRIGAERDTRDSCAGPRRKAEGRRAVMMRPGPAKQPRSEEHTSELQSLMRISYAVFCLKKQKTTLRSHHSTEVTYNTPKTTLYTLTHTIRT